MQVKNVVSTFVVAIITSDVGGSQCLHSLYLRVHLHINGWLKPQMCMHMCSRGKANQCWCPYIICVLCV